MVIVDTADCDGVLALLAGLKNTSWSSDPEIQQLQAAFSQGISSLESFFIRLKELTETTEQSICKNVSLFTQAEGLHISKRSYSSLSSVLSGKAGSVSGSLGWTMASTQAVWRKSSFAANIQAGLVEVQAEGKASADLFEKGKFAPALEASAAVSAHVLGAATSMSWGTPAASVSARAIGEVGAVYGECEAVFSLSEQTLKANVGAAAARGECSAAFSIMGLKVEAGLSGSLCSAEAGFEYSFKNREWEMGAKLGFIAGAGIRLKITY